MEFMHKIVSVDDAQQGLKMKYELNLSSGFVNWTKWNKIAFIRLDYKWAKLFIHVNYEWFIPI